MLGQIRRRVGQIRRRGENAIRFEKAEKGALTGAYGGWTAS